MIPIAQAALLMLQTRCIVAHGLKLWACPFVILIDTLVFLQYRSPWNSVRIGRVLEDLDSLAGNIAYEHW